MSSIIVYVLLLGSAISEDYLAVVFPLSFPPKENTSFTELVVNTTNTSFTTCTIIKEIPIIVTNYGTFKMDLSNQSGTVNISVTNPAEVAIAVQEPRRRHYYTIAPSVELGNEYVLVSSSEVSDKYVCRISSISPLLAVLNIKIPVNLQFNISGTGKRITNLMYSLQDGQFIEMESKVPLYQTAVDSQNKLAVFCKDSSMFQVLPRKKCGKYFQSSCPVIKNTRVQICTIMVNTVKSKRQNIKFNGITYTIDSNFLEIPLVRKEIKWTLQAEYEVCVIFTVALNDGSGNTAIRTKMLAAIPNLPTLTTDDATSPLGVTSPLVVTSHVGRTSPLDRTSPHRITSPLVTTSVSSSYPTDVSTQQSEDPLTTNTKRGSWDSTISSSNIWTQFTETTDKSRTTYSNLGRTAPHRITSPSVTTSVSGSHSTTRETFGVSTQQSEHPLTTNTKHGTWDSSATARTTSSSNIWTQFTETTDKLRTTYSNLGHHNWTKITSKNICICICKKLSHTINNSIQVFSDRKIRDLVTKLKVNKSQLSSRVRTKSCASDDRLSAQSLGYVGGVVIALVLTTIASLDLINLCQKCNSKRKLRKKERKFMCQDRWVSKRMCNARPSLHV